MRGLKVILCLTLTLAFGCEENLDPKTPEGAMHQLRNALEARNYKALLACTSAKTHEDLAKLHTLLKEQRRTIEERYPEVHRGAAKGAYPKGALEAEDSAALFEALITPQADALEKGEGVAWGLTVMGAPTFREEKIASVVGHSGESVEFILTDEGVWKTTVFERPIEQARNRVQVFQQTLEENLKVFAELKRRDEAKKKEEAAKAPPKEGAPGSP